MTKFDEFYIKLLKYLLTKAPIVVDKRTFHKKALSKPVQTSVMQGIKFETDLLQDGLPILTIRKLNLKVAVGELVWFIRGDNSPNGIIRHFTKIWDAFIEDDGTVTSYGHRWRKWFKRDQLLESIELLKKDLYSRHSVFITWDPASDSLITGKHRMNVPCHLANQLVVVNNKLHMHSIWRSEDIIFGYPNDILGQALLQLLIAKHLNLKPGKYIHYTTHLHLYKNHEIAAVDLIHQNSAIRKIDLNLTEDLFQKALASDKDAIIVGEWLLKQINKDYKVHHKLKKVNLVV